MVIRISYLSDHHQPPDVDAFLEPRGSELDLTKDNC